MAEVGLVDIQIDPWHPFSKFRLVFPTVTVSQAKVILEKNGDGSANLLALSPLQPRDLGLGRTWTAMQ